MLVHSALTKVYK